MNGSQVRPNQRQQTYNICQGTDERKKATLLYKVVKRTTNLQYMTGE